jgi:serine protease
LLRSTLLPVCTLFAIALPVAGQDFVSRSSTSAARTVLRPLPPVRIDTRYFMPERLIVKFDDSLRVRLREGRLIELDARSLGRAQAILSGQRIERLFGQEEDTLAAWRREGQAALPEAVPPLADLANYYRVSVEGIERSEQLLNELLLCDEIETAYPVPRPVLHGDLSPVTPQLRAQQDYLGAPPGGIGWRQVSGIVGARFHGGRIAHVEGDWTLGHEDLPKLKTGSFLQSGTMLGWAPHGDACLGILVGAQNGYGVEGMASAADALYVSAIGDTLKGGLQEVTGAKAMLDASARLRPGDVMTSSFGWLIPGNVHAPADWPQACFDVVRQVTARGIYYVTSAGNSNTWLEDPLYGGRYLASATNSGAIICGSTSNEQTVKAPSSNYGARVDANGWGKAVVTTGNNGDLFWPNFDPKQTYTQSFAGTSSATPIVAGAVAAYAGALREQHGLVLTPAQMRADLRSMGLAIGGSTPAGHRPNLPAMFASRNLPDGQQLLRNATIGGSWQTRVFGKPGDVFVQFESGARSRIPFGVNRPLLIWPSFITTNSGLIGSGGYSDITRQVPNVKSLGNIRLYTQAFNFTSAGIRASNSCEVWIEPSRGDGPAAPAALRVDNSGKDFADLRWVDVANNESGYIVRIAEPWQNYTEAARLGPNATGVRLTGLKGVTDYWVRVVAFNSVGESPHAELFFRTKEANVPDAPSNLQATSVGYRNVSLSWKDNSNNEDGFRVAISKDSFNWDNLGSTSANVTQITAKELRPGKQYWFRVRAFKDTSSGPIFSGYTQILPVTMALPAPVQSLKVTKVQPFKVIVEWVDGSTDEDGFRLQARELPGGNWAAAGLAPAVTLPATTGSAEVTGLKPDTDYEVRVLSYRSFTVGASPERFFDEANAPVQQTRTRSAQPSKPDSLGVTNIRMTGLTLVWQDRSTIEDRYQIFASTDQGQTWPSTPLTTLAGTTTTGPVGKDLKGMLLPGTSYRFRVRATKVWAGDPNTTYYSDWSDPADGTTAVPAKVSSLTVAQTFPFKIRIRWVDAADNEDGFRIQTAPAASGPWTAAGIFDQPLAGTGLAQEFAIEGLSINTRYYIRVLAFKAVNGQRYWDESAPVISQVTDDPRPATPTSVSASSPQLQSMLISFRDNSTIEDSYNISASKDGQNWDRVATVAGTSSTGTRSVRTNSVLDPNTSYQFRVRALKKWAGDPNTTYYSPYSSIVSGKTSDPSPATPSNLEHTQLTVDTITLRWRDNASNETAFATYRSTRGAAGPWTPTGTASAVSGTGGLRSKTISGLAPATRYWFAAQAYRDYGGTRYYSGLTVIERTTASPYPPAPSSVTAAPVTNENTVRVTWVDNSKAEDRFAVYTGPGSAGPWTLLGTHAAVNGTGSRLSKDFGGLARNTTYWVTVQAIRVVGGKDYHSTLAPAVSFRTYDRLSNAPTNLRLHERGKIYVSLEFDDNSLNETEFRVQYRRSGGSWTQYLPPKPAVAGTGLRRKRVEGLARGTTYDFRIRAYTATAAPPGFTAWTNVLTVTTKQ